MPSVHYGALSGNKCDSHIGGKWYNFRQRRSKNSNRCLSVKPAGAHAPSVVQCILVTRPRLALADSVASQHLTDHNARSRDARRSYETSYACAGIVDLGHKLRTDGANVTPVSQKNRRCIQSIDPLRSVTRLARVGKFKSCRIVNFQCAVVPCGATGFGRSQGPTSQTRCKVNAGIAAIQAHRTFAQIEVKWRGGSLRYSEPEPTPTCRSKPKYLTSVDCPPAL